MLCPAVEAGAFFTAGFQLKFSHSGPFTMRSLKDTIRCRFFQAMLF
jgi:hypothetical protein